MLLFLSDQEVDHWDHILIPLEGFEELRHHEVQDLGLLVDSVDLAVNRSSGSTSRLRRNSVRTLRDCLTWTIRSFSRRPSGSVIRDGLIRRNRLRTHLR